MWWYYKCVNLIRVNTWVKVYLSSHESVTRVCPMGGAPPHTDTDSASRLWAVSKLDCLKQCVRVLALSLVLLNSLPVLATWKPVRWTLALKPTIWRSPRPCQSRNIAETALNSLRDSNTAPRWRHATATRGSRVSQSNTWKPTCETRQRTEATRWTHAGNETKAMLWMQ